MATVNLGQGGGDGMGGEGGWQRAGGPPEASPPPPRSRQSPGGSLASLWVSGVSGVGSPEAGGGRGWVLGVPRWAPPPPPSTPNLANDVPAGLETAPEAGAGSRGPQGAVQLTL